MSETIAITHRCRGGMQDRVSNNKRARRETIKSPHGRFLPKRAIGPDLRQTGTNNGHIFPKFRPIEKAVSRLEEGGAA